MSFELSFIVKFYNFQKVMELWEMVKTMSDIPLKVDKDILSARCSLFMQTSLIKQARTYLEKK